jgi:hypothetical protein
MANGITLYLPNSVKILPDNDQWTNRFEIRSESSGRIYVIAQNKNRRSWGCSCPGWKRHRNCKHLQTIGVPCFERPFEVAKVEGGRR